MGKSKWPQSYRKGEKLLSTRQTTTGPQGSGKLTDRSSEDDVDPDANMTSKLCKYMALLDQTLTRQTNNTPAKVQQ